jgi:hypothetical protein
MEQCQNEPDIVTNVSVNHANENENEYKVH